ncbi:MAG: hypothetical protein JSW28_05000 [Thermoplasmata archaeon]|nr:MAG: hypothetical protein JSW28_05000 [Thermoplasmata archaeon]
MGKRYLWVLITVSILAFTMAFPTVMGGDQYDPEVEDDIGDSEDPAMQFRDIEAAWLGGEGNTTLEIALKLVGEPPGLADLASAQDTATFDYEVYFDVGGTGYAVVAEIQYAAYIGAGTPIGGVYSPTQTWEMELRQVTYATFTDIIQDETPVETIDDFDFDGEQAIITWTITKESIGVLNGFEGRGTELSNTWAAVWDLTDNPSNTQRDPLTAWDHGQTHYTDPGRTYRIRGEGSVDYNVELSVDEDEKTTYGGTPAEFIVYVRNNGTNEFTVDLYANYGDEDWNVTMNPTSSTIAQGQTRTVSVSVTPPKDVENGTELVVSITGEILQVEGNGTVPIQDAVTLRVIGLSPEDKNEDDLWDLIMEYLAVIAAVVGIVIVAIIILIVLVRRK